MSIVYVVKLQSNYSPDWANRRNTGTHATEPFCSDLEETPPKPLSTKYILLSLWREACRPNAIMIVEYIEYKHTLPDVFACLESPQARRKRRCNGTQASDPVRSVVRSLLIVISPSSHDPLSCLIKIVFVHFRHSLRVRVTRPFQRSLESLETQAFDH